MHLTVPVTYCVPPCHPERSEGSLRHLMLVFHHEIDPPARHRVQFTRPLLLVSGKHCHVVLPLFEPCLSGISHPGDEALVCADYELSKMNRNTLPGNKTAVGADFIVRTADLSAKQEPHHVSWLFC